MRTIRTFAGRNYLTLILCSLGLIALVGSGLSSASSSNDSTGIIDRRTSGSSATNTVGIVGLQSAPGTSGQVKPQAPLAPIITATLADALQVDNNNSGKADPGDTLMYTVTITNTGSDATGVVFTDDLSQNGGNLTLVPGSVNSAPVARPDTYPNGVGNTRMTVNAANGVLANDFDPDGTTPTAVAITNGPTTNGGTVNLLADGSFIYDPPVGFTGSDTFTYTATDGTKTDTATVTITLTERVWYVNSAAAVDGDGRSNTPFKVITGHLDGAGGSGDVDGPNDYIFLFAGSYSVTTLPLESGQRLIGQGVNLVVNSQTLVTATTKPTLTGSATAVTLSTGNTVSGLNITGTSGITGSSVGALTVSVVGATGSNGPAVDLQTTGALNVQFDSLSSSGSGIGVRLTSPASGTFTVTGTTTVNKTSGTGDGIIITGGGATQTFTGAVSVTTFSGRGIVANAAGGITISSSSSMVDATGGAALDLTSQNLGTGWNFSLLKSTNSSAEGIKMQGCIQNLTATTTNIQTPTGNGIDIQSTVAPATLSFGTTTVNKTAAGTGINLVSNSTATVAFGALTLTTGNGSGLVATTSGIVNVSSGTIAATGGPALNLSSITAGVTLTSASSTNSAATGINLATVAGSVSIGTTTTTNPVTIGINATSNSATLSFGGTTSNTSGGSGVVLGGAGAGNTGTITFGTLNIAPDNNQRGLLAQDNTNTITIGGGTISTVGSPAASGQPAVEITRSSSTTPITITLTSVSANGSSTSGIILTNTNGSFTITGANNTSVGGDNSGGTIQSTTSHGVSLTNVQNPSFTNMNIQNTGRSGVDGQQVTNFTFKNGKINNSGTAAAGQHDESNISFNDNGVFTSSNVSGTVTITQNQLSNARRHGIQIENGNGTISNLTISNNTLTSSTNASVSLGTAILAAIQGSASTTANLTTGTISTNTITNFPSGEGIAILGGSGNGGNNTTATLGAGGTPINITANSIAGQGAVGQHTGSNAIRVSMNSQVGVMNCNISCNGNTSCGAPGLITNVEGQTVSGFAGGSVTGKTVIDNNVSVLNHTVMAGTAGIAVQVDDGPAGAGTSAADYNFVVSNNKVSQYDGFGIRAIARASLGKMDVQIANNQVGSTIQLTNRNAIRVDSGSATGDVTLCMDMTGNAGVGGAPNKLTGSGVNAGIGLRKQGTVAATNDFGIVGIAANPNNNTVQTFVGGNNLSADGPGGSGSVAGVDILSGNNYTSCTQSLAPSVEITRAMHTTLRLPESGDAQDFLDTHASLDAAHGQAAKDGNIPELSQQELIFTVQSALSRWYQMSLPPEDMSRLQAATFELADLSNGHLSTTNGTQIKIDKTAAGYGWYFDEAPYEDSEFQVLVTDKELQTTESSPAHGKMDLLTVVMRELAEIYIQGKDSLPKAMRRNLQPLLESTLSPGVRRLPLDRWNVKLTTGSLAPNRDQVASQTQPKAAPAQRAAQTTSRPARQRGDIANAISLISSAQVQGAAEYAVLRRPLINEATVIGVRAPTTELQFVKSVRYASMNTQQGGVKNPAPPKGVGGGIVSVGPFNLPAGETVTIMFNATIDTPVIPPGTVQVCTRGAVTFTGGPAGGVLTTDPGPPVVNGATCTPLAQANLAVTKTDTPDPVIAGSNITYTVTATNNGPDSAFNVSLTDAIPANTTFVSTTTPAGWTRSDSVVAGGTGTLSFTKASMANAENATFTIVVATDAATVGGTIITNNAVITSDTPDPTPANNTGTATTTVTAQADLAVTKTDTPDPVIAGNNITYTVNFVNNGPGTAQTVTVTDAVPTNTTFVSAVVTTGTGWSTSAPAVGGTGNIVFSKASVPNGETAVFTIVVKVNSNTADGATITNSATAASTTTDPTPGNNTGTATTTVNTQADLAVTKSDSPDPVSAGANITYTVNFVNNGPSDAQTVTVTDAVPTNTTFVSAVVTTGTGWSTSAPAVGGTGNIVFSKGTVTAGETAVFTIVVKVNSNTADGTVISNSATAATTTTDPTSGNNTGTATTTVQARADLMITKTDSPDPVSAGGNLTYTVNFANTGPSDAQTVMITDAVPANATFVSAVVTTGVGWGTAAPSVGGTGNIVFSKATVVAGETAVFTIVVKVNSNTASGTTISNTATAASATTDPTPANNSATATTTVQTSADLAITKTDTPDPSFAGTNITYTINFVNNGPSDAQTVTVTDAVPANTTFVSATVTTGTGWSTSAPAVGGTGNVVFSKATVTSGETAVFTIVVLVDPSTATGTVITNTATAASTTTDPTPANNTATATTDIQAQADLAVTKTDSPDPVLAGNNITYTINFVNNGPGAAQAVTVTDAVPTNATFVSAVVTTGTGWSTSSPAVGGTGNVVFSKATVANGETAVFTIVVKVNSNVASGATISNSATAASTTADPTPGNNTGTATTTVNTQADLSITKTDSPDPVVAGSNITYTITLTNNGPSDAQTVTVTDTVPPANTTLVSAVVTTGTGWSTGGSVTFSKATVAAGETAVFTIVVKVNSSAVQGTVITNTATAATATTDPNSGNNSSTATTDVIVRADLAVTKSDSPDPVIAGNNLTYTITYINNGPSDAQTVTVTDAVPANSTFVSATVTVGAGWSVSAPAVGGTGNIVFSKATSLALDAATFTIVVNINANTANGATITNSATAATATTDPTPGNNTGTATTTVQAVADIAVTKSDSPDPVFAGNNITYTVNFVNNGPSFAQSVTVTDAVPANTTFVSATVTTGTGWSTSAPAVGGTGNVVFSKTPVANGETAVFTIVVKVNTNTAGGTTITNSAVGASTTTDPTPGNNTGTATTTVQTQADLAVTKTDSPDPVIAGNNLTYTVNFVNNGPSDAQTVTVTDPVPTNATFVSATVTTGTGWSTSSPAVGGTGNIVFSKAVVASGETAVFTIVVHIDANTPAGATITNSAVASSNTGDPNPSNNTGTATTTVQTNADLAVTKSDSPDPVFAGNNLTYTINFVNNGPSDAQTVTVTDAVPANATFVSATVTTGTGWSTSAPAVGATGNVVFSKGTAAAGETAVFTIVVKVNSNTPNGATITNSATAASPTTDPTPGNNTGTATTTVQTRADIAVTKSDSPDPVFAGANLTYTINFVNNGPSDAQTVTVTDAVPANTTFVSATVTTGTGWTTTAPAVGGTGNVVFSKATVTAGEAAVFTIVVKVNSSTVSGTTITNSVTAATATTDPTPGNNTASTTTTVQTQADISVVKTDSPDPVVVSQNLTYTINFANNGPSDAQTVTVTDPMPPNTTFVSATVTTGSGWSISAPAVGGTGTITFSKATVAAGQTAVFTIVVNVNLNTPNNTILTNTVTAATATADPNTGNNSSTTTTTVLAQADLAITKMAAPDPSCVGGDITYSLNIVNNGPGPGINTTVTDATPANTTFVSAAVMSGSGWSISSPAVGGTGNVVFSKASFGIGETAVLVVVVKVNAGTLHGTVISNTATIASTIPDPTPGNNSAMASTTVDPIPPTITCPGNVTVKAAQPGDPCVVVNYPAPVASDNCPGVGVVCVPPSGTCFPLGTTTVTCTATDLAGNTASCSFTVSVFDLCVQDDSDPSTVVLINSLTGDYRFCCHGVVYTGKGTITKVGLLFTLQHNATDRRVLVKDDEATHRATGSIQAPPGTIRCSITDRNTQDNTCSCP